MMGPRSGFSGPDPKRQRLDGFSAAGGGGDAVQALASALLPGLTAALQQSGAAQAQQMPMQTMQQPMQTMQQPMQQPMQTMQTHQQRAPVGGPSSSMQIPNSCVGWLKGRNGAMVKDIQNRSGATIDVDQNSREGTFTNVQIRGTADQQRIGYGLVVGEITKALEASGDSPDAFPLGIRAVINIETQFVGWVKGPRGKVVQDVQLKSGTRIDVDQTHADTGMAQVRIYGTAEGTYEARRLIAAELSKVSPETAAAITSDLPPTPGGGNSYFPNSAGAGEADVLQVPNSCVGWLKGRSGGMIRDIECRSGCTLDVDLTAPDSIYTAVNIRGTPEQRKLGYGLVAAEVMKALTSTGESPEIFPVGTIDEFQLALQFVGWVKGPQGKVVQEIQVRSGTRVDIDQSNRESGFAAVRIFGVHSDVLDARRMIAAEISKVDPQTAASISADYALSEGAGMGQQQASHGQSRSFFAEPRQTSMPQTSGPGMSMQSMQPMQQMQPMQSMQPMQQGAPAGNCASTIETVSTICSLLQQVLQQAPSPVTAQLQNQLGSVAQNLQQVAAQQHQQQQQQQPMQMQQQHQQQQQQQYRMDNYGQQQNFALQDVSHGSGQYDVLHVPVACVGWLKGRQGGMIRDIEARSGATIDVDQTMTTSGFNAVSFRGSTEQQKKLAYGLVVSETMKAMMSTDVDPQTFPIGARDEFNIDNQFIGWVKGPQGKVVQDIQIRTGTRIDIDQATRDLGYAIVRIFGMVEGIQDARRLIAAELSKISPDTAMAICADIPAAAAQQPMQAGGGIHDTLQVPNSCVGWLKGRSGAMIRDIEGKAGATIDIDNSSQEFGYNLVHFRSASESGKALAYGLIVAEVVKAMGSTNEPMESFPIGARDEFRIDTQFVGWVKGPQGKVVQDIQLRSGTRIDVDQTARDMGYATIKVMGTAEGVQEAKRLLAMELSKVSPETAASISPGMVTMAQGVPANMMQTQFQGQLMG
eukprot:TRINITY_DN589_c0_g1_i1.p1 TRINITY_DN589_c0_g1~~TRINITY_DN589_c0_g1_i1.p1  ORF type:complete len:979 (-),score=164.69 TRINITY_DN589_c0_g1_i1:140-3076(-)